MASSTHSNVLYSNELFKQYIMQISSSLIWKNTSKAFENESTDLIDLYLIELYITANRGLLNFDIIKSFPRAVLRNLSIRDSEIELYASDKSKIPHSLRVDIVKKYAEMLTSIDIDTGYPSYYVESNNYYRMLMGLPNKEDSEFIYNTDPRWDTKTPIHQLSRVDRLEMEGEGILDALYKKYPSKEYIKYLGRKSINPFKARVADRFELLYYDESSSDTLSQDFVDVYNSARQLIISVYFNKSFIKENALYENFLAMSILFITIQTMQHKYLKVDITRDFYDIESLKLIYDSYGVPFYDDIPLDYHRKIVKNINRLISYKGSSQVFFDLFDIFDIGTIDIYSYFLTKTHIMDAEGNPSFIIKKDSKGNDMYDVEGNPILDESNYKIQFSRTKIYDDPSLSIADDANDTDYDILTSPDPYWINDPALMEKLAGENFNYLESKYIGIQTVFDLMKITYENAYIFRLITDNKKLTEALTFKWTDLGIECSIFDAFIYLAQLYCRKRGYEGIIHRKDESDIHGIPAIMDTLGYNYENAITIVKEAASNSTYIKNNVEILDLVIKSKITNINSINEVYNNIEKIRDIIIAGYTNAKSIDEYHAYRELYNSLMISKEIESVYTRPKKDEDGNILYDDNGKPIMEIYETFKDVLNDISPELMQRYILIEDDDSVIDSEMTIVIDQIESLISNLKYISMSIGIGTSNLIDSLFKILKFFKSAKSELVSYNIIYTITMRGINFFKFLDTVSNPINESKIYDYNKFIDMIKLVTSMISHKNDIMQLKETFKDSGTKTYLNEYLVSLDTILIKASETIDYIFKDRTWYTDFLQSMQSSVKISSKMIMEDISDTPLTYLEMSEFKYLGIIKDNINKFSDILKEDPKNLKIYYLTDILSSLDGIRYIIDVINSRSRGISTDLKMSDSTLKLNLNAMIHDNNEINTDKLYSPMQILDDSDDFKMSSKLNSVKSENLIKSIENVLDGLCQVIDNSKISSDNDFEDYLLLSEFYKDSDNSIYINDIIKAIIEYQLLNRDIQSLIDTSIIIKTNNTTLESSMTSDSLFEFNSSGEIIPIK